MPLFWLMRAPCISLLHAASLVHTDQTLYPHYKPRGYSVGILGTEYTDKTCVFTSLPALYELKRNAKFWHVVKTFWSDRWILEFTWEIAMPLVMYVLWYEQKLKRCRMQAHYFCSTNESEKSAAKFLLSFDMLECSERLPRHAHAFYVSPSSP